MVPHLKPSALTARDYGNELGNIWFSRRGSGGEERRRVEGEEEGTDGRGGKGEIRERDRDKS